MPGICSVIEAAEPDIVVLQEYRDNKSIAQLHDTLEELSLLHRHHASQGARDNSVMIASRYPMEVTAWTHSIPESNALMTTVQPDGFRAFELLAAHFPHKKKQIPYFSALLDQQVAIGANALLLGDLNCGIPFEDSETKTFENTHLFQALLDEQWIDSWRTRHENGREFSWISPRGNGYRYDHCLATKAMDGAISSIQYLHEVRDQKLSDHSPIVISVT